MEATEQQAGELAMEIIRDYPLYASTSGITYAEAIRVAEALDYHEYQAQLRELEAELEKESRK